jgi:hypothetical protein
MPAAVVKEQHRASHAFSSRVRPSVAADREIERLLGGCPCGSTSTFPVDVGPRRDNPDWQPARTQDRRPYSVAGLLDSGTLNGSRRRSDGPDPALPVGGAGRREYGASSVALVSLAEADHLRVGDRQQLLFAIAGGVVDAGADADLR